VNRHFRIVSTMLAAGLLALSLAASGCAKAEPEKKEAPLLTLEQVQAGLIAEENHPVDQEKAQELGCNCHIATANK